IVNLNNQKLLEACLTSIYKNTHKISFEITVVDNASTDGSQKMVRTKFPAVYLIENKENLGFSRANNLGLKNCQARYALLLNNDTVLKNDALDKMVAFMDKSPKVGATGPKLLNVDGTIQHQGGLLGKKFWLAKEPVKVNFVIGAALMVRKDIIDLVGLLDENLFFYNEDLDWCIRIRKAGWHVFFLPEPEITHYSGYSSKRTFNHRLFIEGFKGGLYFCRKHYGELAYNIYRLLLGLLLLLVLPFQIVNLVKFKAYLKIIMTAWRGQITKPVLK
ncbi:MAG: glycosyltransferase family 2 protein, partial [Candidatus Margulisbacteria bacterium]|nr:glycosyltransferase family 2 protein [Candidatus Margulisiibacteriota bacterium]